MPESSNIDSGTVYGPSFLIDPCWPVTIYVLGDFRLLQHGQPMPVRVGEKGVLLLAYLALEYGQSLSSTGVAKLLWPQSPADLAANSLRNLVYGLQKLLVPGVLAGPLLQRVGGSLRLNVEAGIGVDTHWFDDLAQEGARSLAEGDEAAAIACYSRAVTWYGGDLCIAVDARTTARRERLRARCLALLSWLADHSFRAGDTDASLEYLWRLLAIDACHEEAHRMVMRCYMRRGERGAALRQYELCAEQLRMRFGATPESTTVKLFEQIRDQPPTADAYLTRN